MTTVPPMPNLLNACGRQRPQHHREFPVGYSSAGCSPAEPAFASPTQETYIILPLRHIAVFFHSGISLLYMLVNLFPIFVSHTWGAVHPATGNFKDRGRSGPITRPHIAKQDSNFGYAVRVTIASAAGDDTL